MMMAYISTKREDTMCISMAHFSIFWRNPKILGIDTIYYTFYARCKYIYDVFG
jgi:hypothetical protein